MDAESIPDPLTVEEFEKIPDPPGGRYELHYGEAVFVAWPERQHRDLQRWLRETLDPLAKPFGFIVDTDYPYRPLAENELWGADVACVAGSRDRQTEKWLLGSPELVIEVKSPSDDKVKLNIKAMTSLIGGAVEFWIVDAQTRTVTVFTHGGMHRYEGDMAVPVAMFGGQIRLAELFAEIE